MYVQTGQLFFNDTLTDFVAQQRQQDNQIIINLEIITLEFKQVANQIRVVE